MADRRAVWSQRLPARANTETIVAELGGRVLSFIDVMFDDHPGFGSLVDNLHVAHDHRRAGSGTRLLSRGAGVVAERVAGAAMYLWVQKQNTAAREFYRRSGATAVELAPVSPPGGDPTRLHGSPRKLRMVWSDASQLSRLTDDR